MSAEDIVRDLAALPCPHYDYLGCHLCGWNTDNTDVTIDEYLADLSWHDPECPWRRAVEHCT